MVAWYYDGSLFAKKFLLSNKKIPISKLRILMYVPDKRSLQMRNFIPVAIQIIPLANNYFLYGVMVKFNLEMAPL